MKKEYVVLFIVMLVLFLGCKKKEEAQQKNDEAIPVTVGKVSTMDITYPLQRVGSLEAKESVVLKAESEGRVTEIFFEEGDWVNAGHLLVKIDDAKIKTTMNQLEARIHQLEIQLANSERTLSRKEPLVKEDLVSKQDFDDLTSKIEIEKATIKEIKAQLAHNRELLQDTEIRAPFPGATSERQISVGDFLRIGDPIVRLVQLNPLEVSFRVDEKYKPYLYLKQPVTVTVAAYPEKKFQGEVYFISPDVDITTRTFLVKSRIANNENLLNPGMFAGVTIITETHKDALTVPWESVVQLEEEVYVYVVNTETAKKIPVKLGQVSEQVAEVFGDLKSGQSVVKEGKFALRDGAKVKIIPETPTSS
ncbi:MAG: efflux RND transporter periplasmic adaptor subunit [Pseudomonadota bacterium]